jgi:hypothetical protein
MILTLEYFEFDYNDHFSQILVNCVWALCSTAHSILDATHYKLCTGERYYLTSYLK